MRRQSTARFLVVFVLLFLLPNPVFSTTYVIPDDYRIACLDLQTGKLLWVAQPEGLGRARIVVKAGVVIAPAKKGTYYVDARSGKLLPESEIPQEQTVQEVGPLDPLPHNLTSSDGIVFEYDQGNTRNLVGRQNGKIVYTRHLEYWPYDLHVAGHLAIFTLAGLRAGGGEVYAYDIKQDQLVWEFDASQKFPGLSEYTHTDIAIDDNRVLVSVDQVIFALAAESGHVLWMTKLPRQTIRKHDAPWTKIGRLGDLLLVECYEDLFALDANNGKLLWSFDTGPFGEPWPTIKDGRAYVLTRGGPVKLASFSFGGLIPEKAISAVKIKRDKTSPTGYSMEFLSRRDIPRDAEIYWSLKPPPLPRPEHLKNGRVVLRLVDVDRLDPYQREETISQLDITASLHESGSAYVKFTGYGEKAVLLKDGAKILEVKHPESTEVGESEPTDETSGLKYFGEGQFAEAIPYLERAYRLDSDQTYLGEHLAYAYATIGRHPEAIKTLAELSQKLGEPSAYGWELLVYSCRQTGEWRRLLGIADAAIVHNPRSAEAYRMAGFAASQLYGPHSDEAKRYYAKYLELNPNSEETAFVKQLFPDL